MGISDPLTKPNFYMLS